MAQLYSLEVERHTLSSFLKHPNIFPEVDGFLNEYDFVNDTNRTIFAVIRSILSKSDKIDRVLVGEKIRNLGVKFKDDIDIFGYLRALSESQITPDAGIKACKELIKLRVRRDITTTAHKVVDFISKNGELSIDELISGSDKIYNETLNSYNIEDEPKDLYGGIEELLNKTAENPKENTGLITPYAEFNKQFGGIRSGNGLYAVVSRPKHGKSTWLLNMAEGITMLNEDTVALYLDTEMQTEVSQFRAAAAKARTPMWYLETGNWIKNQELAEKVMKTMPEFKKRQQKVFHLNVANKPVEQICSLIRRFYYKNVGRISGRRLVVVYDYIKLTGESLSNNWAEHQAVGEKINYLNDIGNELDVGLWAAMQLNRSAEDGRDDSSAISTSDRLQWFAAFVAIFRRKRLDEIAEDGIEFGSHKMISTATRFQGKDAAGHHDMVNVSFDPKKPRYETNFINYNIEDFAIDERGTLEDVVKRRNQIYVLEKVNKKKNKQDDDGSL